MKTFKKLPWEVKKQYLFIMYDTHLNIFDIFMTMTPEELNRSGQKYLKSIKPVNPFYAELVESLYQAHQWAKGNCLANVRVRKIEE